MNMGIFRTGLLIAALPAAALLSTSANAQSIYTDPDILELTPSQQTTVYRTIVRENVTPRAPIVASSCRSGSWPTHTCSGGMKARAKPSEVSR